jgi:uncharacterized protein YkwD
MSNRGIRRGAARRLVTAGVVLSCAFVATGASEGPASAVGARRQLLALINQARERHDAPRVRLASRASRRAERHSERMARAGRVFSSGGYPYRRWGENVSCGRSIEQAHRKVMNDQTARSTLLNARYHRVGLGIATARPRTHACRRASFWITEVFFRG